MGRADARRAQARESRRAPKSGGIRRLFTWKKLLGAFFGIVLLGMGAFGALYVYVDVPAANAMAERQSNVYKYSDGSVLARTGKGVNRQIVDLDEVPEKVQHAFVAAENKSFYKDQGVDLKGTTRALLNTVSGKGKQGGSTITQQYVKNFYLTQDPTVSRKLKELVISLKVDQQESKEKILAGYINTAYYGRGASGIQAAAQAYYGVDAKDLNVSQGAYLASLLQAPSQYDWNTATDTGKKLVKERWAYTLRNMVEMKWLTESEKAGLEFPYPDKPKPAQGMEGQTGYLVEAANKELEKQGVSAEDREAAWLDLHLTVDKKRQKALEKSVDDQLESKLDREGNKVDATVQALRHLRRPEDRQGRRPVRRRGLHQALHQQRHPPGLPARLHLQAAGARLGPGERVEDAGRQPDRAQHGVRRHQQAARRRQRHPVRPAEPGRPELRSGLRPEGLEQLGQLRLRADDRRRDARRREGDRARPRRTGQELPRAPRRHPRHHERLDLGHGRMCTPRSTTTAGRSPRTSSSPPSTATAR